MAEKDEAKGKPQGGKPAKEAKGAPRQGKGRGKGGGGQGQFPSGPGQAEPARPPRNSLTLPKNPADSGWVSCEDSFSNSLNSSR